MTYNKVMQTHDLSILECDRCHYRTIRAIKQCPVCRNEQFQVAKLRSKPSMLREAFALHADQALRLSQLASRVRDPWHETLLQLSHRHWELAEGLGCYHSESSEVLEELLQQAISAQFQTLPKLAEQAGAEGDPEFAIHLKWLASKQGELVSSLGQIRQAVQNSQKL